MHVLMIPSWYPEHAGDFNGSFFPEQAGALVAAGHTVGVLVARPFPVYELAQFRARTPRPAADEGGVLVLRSDVLLPVPKAHRLNQQRLDAAIRRLYDAYVAERGVPDVLHAHAMFTGGIAAAHLSRATGVPFIVTEHRPSSLERLREPGYRGMALRAAREAGGLVAVARGFVPELNDAYGVEGSSGWTYVPGLLSPQFEHIAPRAVPAGPFVFGHVSHLDPGKRVDLLIQAFADAFGSAEDVRLRIAGGSDAAIASLRTVAIEAGVGDRVDFVGPIPRHQIAEEFARYHVFALTSEAEAFGTVLWEAMACGLPILSTDTWAGNNAVTEQTGVMVLRDDRVSIATGLRELKDGFEAYDSGRIRRICLDHCGERAFVALYEDIYREAMAR